MNHFVVFPSAVTERANEALSAWHMMGYNSFVYQDLGAVRCNADVVLFGKFPGYYHLMNQLVEAAIGEGADLVTCASDDMRPDPDSNADEVAAMYFDKFPQGQGVMQATGDRQGIDSSGRAAAERICGSPTFGRQWIVRSYEGKGPFWSGYNSFYADEDLFEVSKYLGLLYQEPRLIIEHLHWSFGRMEIQLYHKRNQIHWDADKALFDSRKAAGFPKSGLLPV